MGETNDIYNAFFGQQFLTDTVTPVVMREEIVMGDCEPRTDSDFIELEPVQLDSAKSDQNIEIEPTGHTVTDMDRSGPTETRPTETGPIETGPIETGPIETVPTETGPIESEPTKTGPTKTSQTEDKNQKDLDEITNLIGNLSSDSDDSQQENFGVIFHWSEAPNPKVEINKKMYSVTRVSKKGNLSLRCAASHKKIKGLITSL